MEKYVSTLSIPTKVLRSKERIGLIKARLLGAEMAKGKVLTFLDAHCETTEGKSTNSYQMKPNETLP